MLYDPGPGISLDIDKTTTTNLVISGPLCPFKYTLEYASLATPKE